MRELLTKFLEKCTKVEKQYAVETITAEEKQDKQSKIISMEIISIEDESNKAKKEIINKMSDTLNSHQYEKLKKLLHGYTITS